MTHPTHERTDEMRAARDERMQLIRRLIPQIESRIDAGATWWDADQLTRAQARVRELHTELYQLAQRATVGRRHISRDDADRQADRVTDRARRILAQRCDDLAHCAMHAGSYACRLAADRVIDAQLRVEHAESAAYRRRTAVEQLNAE